jgi:hypothetical protein
MVTLPRRLLPNAPPAESTTLRRERFNFVTSDEGKQLLDNQAQKYLGMSGEEFRRRYKAGEIEDPERSEVVRVSLLLPFAEKATYGEEEHA